VLVIAEFVTIIDHVNHGGSLHGYWLEIRGRERLWAHLAGVAVPTRTGQRPLHGQP